MAVCLSAGDINTGNFDDFWTVILLCRSRGNTWVHVDGAFGLWAKVSPHFGHLLDGVDEADLWATDAHRWLNTPFDIGFVAIRHTEAHRAAMSVPGSVPDPRRYRSGPTRLEPRVVPSAEVSLCMP